MRHDAYSAEAREAVCDAPPAVRGARGRCRAFANISGQRTVRIYEEGAQTTFNCRATVSARQTMPACCSAPVYRTMRHAANLKIAITAACHANIVLPDYNAT